MLYGRNTILVPLVVSVAIFMIFFAKVEVADDIVLSSKDTYSNPYDAIFTPLSPDPSPINVEGIIGSERVSPRHQI